MNFPAVVFLALRFVLTTEGVLFVSKYDAQQVLLINLSPCH
jgi:hypothetical protein